MNPYLSAILTIAGLVLLFVLWIFYENRKIKNNTLERIRRNWGKPSKRQYEAGEPGADFPLIFAEKKKRVLL